MKYIVHKDPNGMELIETFCEMSPDNHADRAVKLKIIDSDIVSAAFLGIEDGKLVCWGFSKSLTDKLGRDIGCRGAKDVEVFMFHNRTALMWRK